MEFKSRKFVSTVNALEIKKVISFDFNSIILPISTTYISGYFPETRSHLAILT